MIWLLKEFIRKIDRAYQATYRIMILYFVFNIASSALPVLWRFFELYPSPHSVTIEAREEISTLLQPLGLHKLRANTLVRFSGNYCTDQIFRYLLYCCHFSTQYRVIDYKF